MNNLKQIRELYGATQEQIASTIGVNRVTVANWENGNATASSSNQEKLSIYYGIGPEYFYEKELGEDAKQVVRDTAARAKEVAEKSEGKRSKEADFYKMFQSISFDEAMEQYMLSMKMLLATADKGSLEKLKTAALINTKMGKRLNGIIALREEEMNSDEPTLYDLLNEIENK